MKLDRDKLIRAREMLGYGVETTAQEAGVSKNSVLRAEHEEDIRPLTARKIAAALGVRVADLIGESETLKVQPPLFQERLDREREARRQLSVYLQAFEDAGVRLEEDTPLSTADSRILMGLASAVLDLKTILEENLARRQDSASPAEIAHAYAGMKGLDSIVAQCDRRIENSMPEEAAAADMKEQIREWTRRIA